MSISAIHEFAKTASVDDVYDIYELALLDKEASATGRQALLAYAAGRAGKQPNFRAVKDSMMHSLADMQRIHGSSPAQTAQFKNRIQDTLGMARGSRPEGMPWNPALDGSAQLSRQGKLRFR